jgi:hypothetical protein
MKGTQREFDEEGSIRPSRLDRMKLDDRDSQHQVNKSLLIDGKKG